MSSDSQPTLAAFQPVGVEEGPEDAAETDERRAPSHAVYGRSQSGDVTHGDEPAAEPERPVEKCQHCGAPVTPLQRRLFGDNGGVIWHCTSCVDGGALRGGAGAKPDYDVEETIASQTQEER